MTSAEPVRPPGPSGYVALVRSNADFRNLWLGQIVSLVGDWFNLIASAALLGRLTGSGMAIGGLFVVRMLAPFLVSPIAGVVADRYDRRQVLIATDLARAVVVLGFLAVRRPEDVWLLYVLTAVQLALGGIFYPARNAILPDLVGRADLGAANALGSATWSVTLGLGAALGGLVAGAWGAYPAFVIDAGTFLVSAVFIRAIRHRALAAPPGTDRSVRAATGELAEGLRALAADRDLLFVALHKAALALTIAGGFNVVLVTIAQRVFVIGEGGGTGLGLLYAVIGLGTGVGPIVLRRVTGDRDRPLRWAIAGGYVLAAAGTALVSPLTSFGLVVLGTLIRAFGSGANWVFSSQLLFHLAPDHVRGRVFATEFALLTLAEAASAAGAGWLLDRGGVGPGQLLVGMAALTLVPGVAWTVWLVARRPRVRHGA